MYLEKIHVVTLKKDIAYAIIRITLCSAYKSTVQTEQTVTEQECHGVGSHQ